MAKKEKAEEKEKGTGDGERDEEMEDVRDSSAGGGGFAIRDRWMLCHDITPLAMDVLTSKGVSVRFLQHPTLRTDTLTKICTLDKNLL